MQVDKFWSIDDFTLHDTIRPYQIFKSNMFKFYEHGICSVPRYMNEIPNSNRESTPYYIWSSNGDVKLSIKTDNPWLSDTFNIAFTRRMQGMHHFMELHLVSDSLHYKLSRML